MSVSFDHESLVDLFRNQPRLAIELLRLALGLRVEATQVTLSSIDLTEAWPLELRADAIVLLLDDPTLGAIIVEVQLQPDAEKRLKWPLYAAIQRARTGKGVLVLVLTLDEATARWARQAIVLDPLGNTWRPLVIGPADLPVVLEPARALACPELAVLSTVLHGKGPHGEALGRVALEATLRLDEERQAQYADLILYSLHATARAALEAFMARPYEYKSDFARRYYGQGLAEGEAKGKVEGEVEGERKVLRRQIERRFGPLPDWVSATLAAATPEQLEAWAVDLLDATSLDALFQRAR